MTAPRESTFLTGRSDALAEFRRLYAQGTLPHGWLITAPCGTGKATLAYAIARGILSGNWDLPEDSPIFRRIAQGSHSDLLVLEPPTAEGKEEASREIPVEIARNVSEFFSKTAAESSWRVVIVDSADELNISAANCLLKILEEPPPNALLLLLSHNPGRLLPTIRSRCRTLKLPPLTEAQCIQVLTQTEPDISPEEARQLSALSGHSPGVALQLHAQDAPDLCAAVVKILAEGRGFSAFSDRFNSGAVHGRWQAFGLIVTRLLERAVELHLAPDSFTEHWPGEEATCASLIHALGSPQAIAEAHGWALEQFSVAARLHLDYKTQSIAIFHHLLRNAHAAA